jgi:NhaP-type Na+/H+ or K+/H+ antiporter
MLLSLALIILISIFLSVIFEHFFLPGLIAKIFTGILLGPCVLNLISGDILKISADIRTMALVVILLRAGMSLNLGDLKKVGRPAFLMCFIPAIFEITSVVLIAPVFFSISYIEAAILGSVLAAVSPAVVVPKMLHLMEKGYGKKNKIPQLVMAGASIDDIFVIILFASFIGMYHTNEFNFFHLLKVPASIFSGLILGLVTGKFIVRIFKWYSVRDTVKVLVLLSFSFLFIWIEHFLSSDFAVSGLLAVMALGGIILNDYEILAKRLLGKFSKLWVAAELFLFVLVGAAVDISRLGQAGVLACFVIFFALFFRCIGVFFCLIKTPLNIKERVFCAVSYIPKATVQAAIGAIPIASGIASGELILVFAVLSIVITAPLGAIGIDMCYKRCLVAPGTD